LSLCLKHAFEYISTVCLAWINIKLIHLFSLFWWFWYTNVKKKKKNWEKIILFQAKTIFEKHPAPQHQTHTNNNNTI
jgi:hypothetical protein